jgi:WD40 repeat protein
VLAFSPDGKSVVAARNTLSERGVFILSIWDTQTGKESAIMPDDPGHIEHAGTITGLAFSPDGSTLATASTDHSIRVWDFIRREPIMALQGHLSEIWSVAYSPDGQNIVSGAKDGDLKLWSAHPQAKDDVVHDLRQALGFSKDGRRLAALGRDGNVVFLNVATSEIEQQFPIQNGRGRFMPFGPFGQPVLMDDDLHKMVQGLGDGHVKIWDTRSDASTTLKISDGPVEALSPDGNILITRGREQSFHRWDLRSGTNTSWQTDGFKILFSPDGTRLASIGRDTVQIWDSTTLQPLRTLECEEQPGFGPGSAAAFSADSRSLAVVYHDDAIRVWELSSGKLLGTCIGHKQAVRSVAFSPAGKTLATSSDDSTLKLWNIATEQELLTIRHLGDTLNGLMFSPDGQVLVGATGTFSKAGGLRFFRAPSLTESSPAKSGAVASKN